MVRNPAAMSFVYYSHCHWSLKSGLLQQAGVEHLHDKCIESVLRFIFLQTPHYGPLSLAKLVSTAG
jgi:hypothetical protein